MKWFMTIVVSLACLGPAWAQAYDSDNLPLQAYSILKERCYRCHGGEKTIEGIDVLNRDLLAANHGSDEFPAFYVSPGKPDDSELWLAVDPDFGTMPREGSPEAEAMTEQERLLLKQWIEAGAKFPARSIRERVTNKQVLTAIRDYLFQAKEDDRPNLRFVTFTHLYNNTDKVTKTDLRLYQAALSKLVNSLSYERQTVLPKPVPGTEETVFVVDLQELGWNKRELWKRLLEAYPYGLTYTFSHDEDLQQIAKDVELLSGSVLPHLRADWFIFTAAQAPLYDELMDLPPHIQQLERRLGVDFEKNFENDQLARAGFAKSGVSQQNRLLERHEYKSGQGSYWISYDFKPRRARGNLVRFPLGPQFHGNEFSQVAFDHDGGEAIFSLPNGLQGYMLTDGEGNRLDAPAPTDVVYDDSAIAGTPAVVNGISCMHCHKNGMIQFRDEIRNANAVGGFVRDKVRDLYLPNEEMKKLIDADQARFVAALEKVIGPFLKVEEDENKDIEEFPEPIGKIASLYLADLGPQEVALELGFADVATLQAVIHSNRDLLKLGLGTLAQDPAGTIKRSEWEAIDGSSLFQEAALLLQLGTPVTY